MTTDNIRKNFPLLQQMDTIYLDNAATAQRPSCVLAAVQEFYEQKNANLHPNDSLVVIKAACGG